jgi:large subunit ribosomal protein L30
MTFAVVRIRGTVKLRGDITDTLRMLRLNRVNHCVIIPENPYYIGMLNKVKDYVTWGNVDVDTLTMILHHYARASGQRLNDSFIKKNTSYKSLRSYAKAVSEGKEVLSKLKGVNPVLRLHPPIKGYEGVKKPFKDGGALGFRGPEIGRLLVRMILIRKDEGPAKEEKKKKEKKKVKVEKKKIKEKREKPTKKKPLKKKKKEKR